MNLVAPIITGILLGVVSCLSFYQIYQNLKNLKYPAAQKITLIFFMIPVLIGWTEWINLVTLELIPMVIILSSIYKCIVIGAFYYYLVTMMGRTQTDGKLTYSESTLHKCMNCLIGTQTKLCCKKVRFSSLEDVKSYFRRSKLFILQCPFFVLGYLVVYVVTILVSPDNLFPISIASAVKGSSVLLAIINSRKFVTNVKKTPALQRLRIVAKRWACKISMLLTIIQPLLIGLILALSGTYSPDLVYYINSILICAEMILVCLLQYKLFPLQDYQEPIYEVNLING
mmetsp:Transcript_5648/g.8403  ORF Transcript_5648/g.8403 Transcript_5648/m.8403 type:complete len:285 (-) Transcript_5648:14-868(-)